MWKQEKLENPGTTNFSLNYGKNFLRDQLLDNFIVPTAHHLPFFHILNFQGF